MIYPVGAWFEAVRMADKFGPRSQIAMRAYAAYKRQYDAGIFDVYMASCSDYLFDIHPTGYRTVEV